MRVSGKGQMKKADTAFTLISMQNGFQQKCILVFTSLEKKKKKDL